MEQVEVLFKEYDTLRSEIISHTSNAVQLGTAFGGIYMALFTWVVSRPDIATPKGIAVLGSVTVLFVGLYAAISRWVIRPDIHCAAARLRDLEAEINHLCGADLLQWETRWSRAVTGSRRKKRPLAE